MLHGRELREEDVVLRAHAQVLADALHVPRDALLAAHEGVSAGGRDQPHQHADGRALAC